MSKDEALKLWLKSESGMLAVLKRQSPEVSLMEHIAREAWHAAVAHTLAHVAGVFDERADRMGSAETRMRDWAVANEIMRMKP